MKRAMLGAAIAAAFVPAAGAATYSVARWTPIDGIGARAVAVGDINWDTLDDLAVVTHEDTFGIDEVRIFLQQPNGTLQETGDDLQFIGLSPSILMTDIENNSEKEILVGTASGFERIYYNLGYGNYFPRHVTAPFGCANIVAGDLDADHYTDVVCQSLSSGATVFHNGQNGEFTTTLAVATARTPGATLSLGDLTGDGKLDLLLSAPTMSGFSVYPHSGAWGFGAAVNYARPSTASIGANAIGDLDHDGHREALIASNDNAPDAAVWRYPLGAHLGTPVRMATHDRPDALVVSDLNRDGRDDLVVGSADGYGIGLQLQGGTGYAPLGGPSIFAGDSNSIAVGDLDNDSCTDIAYVTSTGGIAIGHGSNCVRGRRSADFDGDGKSDLLWHNDATGANVLWKSADSTRRQVLSGVGAGWRLAGSGDFNRDGKSDLLWHNDATGASVLWYSGSFSTRQTLVQVTDTHWHIVGVGDFDGDGRADVLWRNVSDGRNAIWRSGNRGTQLAVTAVTNQAWRVAGVGDFNADGHDDILWRQPTTGANSIWKSANSATKMSVAANTDPDARLWLGDFNGDRRADLLWVSTNGDVRIWLKPDGTLGQQNDPYSMPSADWRIAATADYDGNGTSDLVWRNMRTGANVVWRSAASALSRPITAITDFQWVVLPQQ